MSMSVTAGRPSVTVPVLSSTTVVTSPARCSASPPLKSTPSSAPFPVATMTAVGTASPMAQGQAIISTATAAALARTSAASVATRYQTTKVTTASSMTTGTKMPEMRSASRCMGARDPCASRIRVTICASTLSLPTVVARKWKAPVPLMVPPITWSPTVLATGIDSPVSMLSSAALLPERMCPSTGMRSPGRTMTTSPGITSATGTSYSSPSRSSRADFGCSPTSARSADDVRCLARASKRLPVRMKAMISTTAS